MRTFSEIKKQISVEQGFEGWNHMHVALTSLRQGSLFFELEDKAAKMYAETAIAEQKKIDAEHAELMVVKGGTYKGPLKIIDKNSILNAPNVELK